MRHSTLLKRLLGSLVALLVIAPGHGPRRCHSQPLAPHGTHASRGYPAALAGPGGSPSCAAQPARPAPLSADEAVRLALEQSPTVRAAASRLEAAAAGVRGARAPYALQAELGPGAGFTNGNAVLSQRLDLFGRRAAQTRIATAEQTAAAAKLGLARLQVAAEARLAYFELVRARAAEEAAEEALALTRQIRDAVRRRVEIGEAPAVQATRAEVEVARVEQDRIRARGEAHARLATLNLLLGRDADASFTPSEELAAPPGQDHRFTAVPPGAELREQALRARPEVAAARGQVEARQGAVALARVQRRPDLFADVAADVWSLDRDNFREDRLGFQARLSFPLVASGSLRAEEQRARAAVRESEAELEVARRAVAVEVERAAAELTAAREVARNYQQTILPRSLELLRSTRAGFETGLTSFLEVLEAQRVARQTRTEYLTSLSDAVRAQIALERAVGTVPGLTPMPPPVTRR